jgi:hypothetical protein
MKVLENTTIEGESPVIEHNCPTLNNVPTKVLEIVRREAIGAGLPQPLLEAVQS